jgi:cytochrome c biogenesis protein ResB
LKFYFHANFSSSGRLFFSLLFSQLHPAAFFTLFSALFPTECSLCSLYPLFAAISNAQNH